MHDLRKHPRYKVIEDIQFEFNSRRSTGEIIDISEGGMLLKIRQIMDDGDRLSLIINKKLSSFDTRIKAEVIHTSQDKAGISFVNITGEQYLHLKEFMREITSKRKYYLI